MSEDNSNNSISTDVVVLEKIKNDFVCDGLSPDELSTKYNVPVEIVNNLISQQKLPDLRSAYIKQGIIQLQNTQLSQAEKLMNLENQFKRMRIAQIESTLQDFLNYYKTYGHFYKVHPISKEILKDPNGLPMQIKIPNIGKEIMELKESFTLSEGLKQMLSHLDDIFNKPKDTEKLDSTIIDVEVDTMFQKRKPEGD